MKLRNTNIGVFVKVPSTQVLEIALDAGFDFCLIDLEHSQLGQAEAMRLASHAAAIGLPALARIAAVDADLVNRLLEAGCRGIQLSTVRTAAQVEELRAATRYAPAGSRSISLAHRRARFGAMTMAEYLAAEEAEPPLVVAQIETATTVDPLEEILTAGPDAVFIGTADLRADVGLDEEAFAARAAEVCDAVESAGIVLGAIGLEDPRITYRVLSSDLALLQGAAAAAVADARS
ncbi:MAG TPA: aldolase/citrate lyase family protein [Solirubrobacterales bacterium]|nr:aldolase/citrate lyase family protein [Solirubrobacterales bacterium]